MKNIILFFLLSTNFISAQETTIDAIILKEIKYLTENKVDKFFFIEQYCIGCNKIYKANVPDCNYGNSKLYIFWEDNSESYFRQLDKCNSPKIKITDEIINYYILNIEEIEREYVKHYQTRKHSDVSQSHSAFSKFYFMSNGNLIVKQFDYFDISTENSYPNTNFEYNNSLKLINLSKSCDEVILKM